MHQRSYTEPVAGAVVIVFPEADDPKLRAVIDRHPVGEGLPSGLTQDLAVEAMRLIPDVVVHEWMHILQVAAYPLLYLRAARAARLLGEPWKHLAESPDRVPLPVRLRSHPRLSSSRLVEVAPQVLEIGPDSIAVSPAPQGRRRGVLTENDLLEEDAAVAQYRIEVGGPGTGAEYGAWLSERSSYFRVFSHLRRLVGADDALALIPIAARIGFATTRPLECLALTVGTCLREGISGFGEDAALWETVLTEMVHRALGGGERLDWRQETVSDPQTVIAADDHRRTMAETSFLPMNPLARWAADDAPVTEVLRRPWAHIGSGLSRVSDTVRRFWPPALVFELAEPARLAVSMSEHVARLAPEIAAESTYGDLIPQFLRFKMLHDVQTGDRPPVRACHHTACRYHGSGLCDGWFPVPRQAENCSFPPLFEHDTGRVMAPDRTYLLPATDSD